MMEQRSNTTLKEIYSSRVQKIMLLTPGILTMENDWELMMDTTVLFGLLMWIVSHSHSLYMLQFEPNQGFPFFPSSLPQIISQLFNRNTEKLY